MWKCARGAERDGWRYSLVRRAGCGLERTLGRFRVFRFWCSVVVWGLKQRLETLVHFQTGSSSSPAPPPSNAPVGHSYPEGGDTAGRPGRGSAEYSAVIGSHCHKSKLVAARLRLPSDAGRAGIVHTTGRSQLASLRLIGQSSCLSGEAASA